MSNTVANAAEKAMKSGQHDVESKADVMTTTRQLFTLMHGFYGNLFLSKFATGDVDAQGKDKGVKSAQMVWASDLAKFDSVTIRAAAERCKVDHKDFPPTLPQFSAICRAMSPVKAYRAPDSGVKQIGISAEAQSAHSKRVREQAMARLNKVQEARTGAVEAPQGVSGLCQLIARAVGCAGGDEVAALRNLENKFTKQTMETA